MPDILDQDVYDEIITVSDDAAAACTRRLASAEGILVGISAGANCHAALQVARRLGPGRTVVTVFSDTGERYLTTDIFQAEAI